MDTCSLTHFHKWGKGCDGQDIYGFPIEIV